MSIYNIETLHPDTESSSMPIWANISYSWFGGAQSPRASFKIVCHPSKGFLVTMRCDEPPEKCRYLVPDSPVYNDDCMEFFADFYPALHIGYVNIEINAAGVILCMFGTSRENRRYASSLTKTLPTVKTETFFNGWTAELQIPKAFLDDLYGEQSMEAGHVLRGNFYKCGDETSHPHWGSWNWLGENPVDFHQPETFGELVLRG